MSTDKIVTKINEAPAITYNFLNINRTDLDVKAEALCEAETVLQSGVTCSRKVISDDKELSAETGRIQTGLGKEFDSCFAKLLEENKFESDIYTVEAGKTVAEPVTISYAPQDRSYTCADQVIVAEENSESTFIVDYSGCKEGHFGLSTKIIVKENAKVTFVTVNLLEKNAVHYDAIGTDVAENARLEVVQIELGADRTYTGTYNILGGRKSECKGYVGYAAKDEQSLDINYVVRQTGKETNSEMYVSGVVMDKAKKTWRGTIDFVKGARNAVGNETEDVLLLSPEVTNKTLPVILCDEEAVEGHHGASIGRLDDDMLFYLNTRGVDSKTAEQLMIKAKINSVSSRIADSVLVEKINNYLEEAFEK